MPVVPPKRKRNTNRRPNLQTLGNSGPASRQARPASREEPSPRSLVSSPGDTSSPCTSQDQLTRSSRLAGRRSYVHRECDLSNDVLWISWSTYVPVVDVYTSAALLRKGKVGCRFCKAAIKTQRRVTTMKKHMQNCPEFVKAPSASRTVFTSLDAALEARRIGPRLLTQGRHTDTKWRNLLT